ncbi:unnamed protein product [Brassica rapa subsp. narinosa]
MGNLSSSPRVLAKIGLLHLPKILPFYIQSPRSRFLFRCHNRTLTPGSSLCSGRTVKCGADAAHGGRLLSLIGKKLYLHVVGVEPSERSTISVDSTEVCDTRESDGIASSDELKQRGFDILMLSELMELEAMKSSSQLNHMVLPRFLN